MSTNFRTVGVWLLSAALATAFLPTPVAAGKGGGGGHGGGGSWGGGSGGHAGGWSGGSYGGADHGNSGWSGGGNHSFASPQGSHERPHGPDTVPTTPATVGPIIMAATGMATGMAAGDSGRAWWHEHGPNWVGWWDVGFGWPWFGFGWWPGYYGFYYGAPYCGGVYADYGYYGSDAVPYAAAYPPAETAPLANGDATAGTATPPANGDALDFYAQALAAFQQGDYRNATRLAGHASIDDPRNPDVHVLLMQGLFAIGEYRGSAMEAHAVASLGKTPDWAKLYGLYGAVEPYTEQLRALEKYVHDKPSAAEGRFLLGFQYLMDGHPEAAQNEFLQALKLTPKDRLAAQLLKQVGGTVPEEIAKQLWPPPPPPKTFDNPKKGK